MATDRVTIQLNLQSLRKYEAQLRAGSPATKKTLQQWGNMHRKWLRDRYLRLSKGGGDWPDLSSFTVAKKGFSTILIHTRELFEKFTLSRVNIGKKSVDVGFVTGTHSDRGKPIREIVGYHQKGTANMPARPILVKPSPQQKKRMIALAEKLLGAEAKKMNPPMQ